MKLSVIFSCLLMVMVQANRGGGAYEHPKVDCEKLSKSIKKPRDSITLPHGSTCEKFYQCTDSGLAEVLCAAPATTHYDTLKRRCEFKTDSVCHLFYEWVEGNSKFAKKVKAAVIKK